MGVNKKAIGLIKDELGGKVMTEVMALDQSCMPIRCSVGVEKCKGVKKCIVKKALDFEDYKQCILTGQNAIVLE